MYDVDYMFAQPFVASLHLCTAVCCFIVSFVLGYVHARSLRDWANQSSRKAWVERASIAELVFKTDGENPSKQAVHDVLAKLDSDPEWRGDRAEGSGGPMKTSPKLDQLVVREVFKKRGKVKFTVSYLNEKFPPLRFVSDSLVLDRLNEAGSKFLRPQW